MSKIFAVGDIHGCAFELRQMLQIIDERLQPEDTLVFLGDYIDRGPDSCGVVEELLAHQKKHPAKHVFLKGNHEDMMLTTYHEWHIHYGRPTINSYDSSADTLLLPEHHEKFFRGLTLYYKEGPYVFAHAGINPHYPVDDQYANDLIWDRSYVGYDGQYIDDVCVIYGHTPVKSVVMKSNQYGIDTACVFGYKLTCIELDLDKARGSAIFHEIKAERSYYE